MKFGQSDIDALLNYWPRLRRAPVTRDGFVSIVGTLGFSMSPAGLPLIVGIPTDRDRSFRTIVTDDSDLS